MGKTYHLTLRDPHMEGIPIRIPIRRPMRFSEFVSHVTQQEVALDTFGSAIQEATNNLSVLTPTPEGMVLSGDLIIRGGRIRIE